MHWLGYLVAVSFFLIGTGCVFTVALSLPGTWILLAIALLIEFGDQLYLAQDNQPTFPTPLLIGCVLVAAFGELLEFLAGMLGAKKAGSTARGVWGSLLGGLVGAVLGLSIPVPFVGSLIGAVIGTFVGAVIGERSAPEATLRSTLRPATGATIGRILGTLSKIPIAIAVWLALSIAAFWP